jgi:hypothetical protein
MSGVGPFTIFGYFASLAHTDTETRGEPPARGRAVWGRVSLALGFGAGGVKVLYQ